MITTRRRFLALTASLALSAPSVHASEAAVIDARVERALEELFATVSGSRDLYGNAKGVLIMPSITKAGLLVGGTYGEGALRVGGETVGYYSVAAASFGLQAGIQTSKQALFFMTTAALEKFRRSQGWELGADAEVTVPDQGLSAGLTTPLPPRLRTWV